MSDKPEATFVRPTRSTRVFRDETGRVIEYGNRWEGGPPEWAYRVTTNPERFEPLHLVAGQLVDHLIRVYQVGASDARDLARTLEDEPPDFVRLVRLSPERADGEPLTIVFTSFPGVVIYAGSRFSEAFPACGCDACDDTSDDVADWLEKRVLTLASGELAWSRRD
jgi:hypothetical protein